MKLYPAFEGIGRPLQLEPVAAFLRFAFPVYVRVFGHVHDLRQLSARKFKRSPGRDVVGVANNPERVHAVYTGYRE